MQPRLFHSFTPSNKKRPPRRVYLFGGLTKDNTRLDTLHQLDLSTMKWSLIPPRGNVPSPRYGHSCVCRRKRLYLFGGLTDDASSNELFIFDMISNTWSKSRNAGSVPSPRSFHSATAIGARMFLFGGVGAAGATLPGVHVYEMDRDLWLPPAPPKSCEPPALAYHTAVAKDRHIYVFGGSDGTTLTSTLWRYHSDSLSWSKMAVLGGPPSPRSFHAAALLGTHMFVFGGWNHLQSAPAAYNDITALDTATGAWHTIQCSGIFPAERYGHAAVALAADHMIFFGGCDLRNQFFDLTGLVRLPLPVCWQRGFDASIGTLCFFCSSPLSGEATRLSSADKCAHVRCLERFLRGYCDGKNQVSSIQHDLVAHVAKSKRSEAGSVLDLITTALTTDANHSLHENLERFILSFHERFAAIGIEKDVNETLTQCKSQLTSYAAGLTSVISANFRLFESPDAQGLLGGVVHDIVVARLHSMIMPMYVRLHTEGDSSLAVGLGALRSVPLSQLGVIVPLRLPDQAYDLPINILNGLPFARSPAQKLDCLVLTSRALHVATKHYYEKHPPAPQKLAMAADDHVGLFVFLVTRCHVSNLHAEMAYISELASDLSSEGEYALVTLQIAVRYIQDKLAR